jgi:hypothetical protein
MDRNLPPATIVGIDASCGRSHSRARAARVPSAEHRGSPTAARYPVADDHRDPALRHFRLTIDQRSMRVRLSRADTTAIVD